MDKWADYGISGVRFNIAHTHIDQVQINPDTEPRWGHRQYIAAATLLTRSKKARRLSLYFATQATVE